jgi:2',3'-cyclic-nucleotide 2'-phosphodiesterase (5'-nucleotidase family)
MLAAALAASGCGPDEGPAPRRTQPSAAPPQRPASHLEPAPVAPFALGEPDALLLVTGGTHGMLEICDCPGEMNAGLARRSGLIASYRAVFDGVFLLDTGDVFALDANDLRNRYVPRGYAQVGYDAVVLGHNEWSKPAGWLDDRLTTPPTYLSTTVAAKPPHEGLPIKRVVTARLGGRPVAFVSHVAGRAWWFFPQKRLDELKRQSDTYLYRDIADLKAAGNVVVLVWHGGEPDARKAGEESGADIVLLGHTTHASPELVRVTGSDDRTVYLAQAGGTEHVGALALRFDGANVSAAEWRLEVTDGQWPYDQRLRDLFDEFIREANRRIGSTQPAGE